MGELLKKKRSEMIEEISKVNPGCSPCLVNAPLIAAGEACAQMGGDREKCEEIRDKFIKGVSTFQETADELKGEVQRGASEGEGPSGGTESNGVAEEIIDQAGNFIEGEYETMKRKSKGEPAQGEEQNG
jgi:hypothetical protein